MDTEQMQSAELTKPEIMQQVPPRLDLKPGLSTPFSEPHWDENPMLKHGFEK